MTEVRRAVLAGSVAVAFDKHGATASEAEPVWFINQLLILEDARHSQAEPRFHALGMIHTERRLHIAFTVRGTRIRGISTRDMHRKEKKHP